MRSMRAALSAALTLALLWGMVAPATAAETSRTIVRSIERVEVLWTYAEDGGTTIVRVHQCDAKLLDSIRSGGSSSVLDRHLRISLIHYAPDQSIDRYAYLVAPSGALSLGTALRGGRIRGAGTGLLQVTSGGVTTEQPVDFVADLRITGTGAVTTANASELWGPDEAGSWWQRVSTTYTRDGTWTGTLTMAGAPTMPSGTPAVVSLTHEDRTDTRVAAP